MNNRRRAALNEAIQLLNKAVTIVENTSSAELDAMDNYPENLQYTERFEAMEDAVDNLEEASEKIGEAVGMIEEAKECIEAAMR